MSAMHYREPDALPGGFYEAVQGVASWSLDAVRKAYRLGYNAGVEDAAKEWREIVDRIGKPPTGCACIT